MNYSIVVSEIADDDLNRLFEYIAFSLMSIESAIGQLDRLQERIMSLNTMPERFRLYDKEPWHSRGLRIMPVDNYLVFYTVDIEAGIVTIVRVMYGRRDIDQEFSQ